MHTVKMRLAPRPRRRPPELPRAAADAPRRRLPSLTPRPVEVRPDAVIAERYRIDMILGRSRGVLCSAVHLAFGRRVALRVIAPSLTNPKEIDRFHREARILSQLESEHVARIYDFGTLEDDSLYFAREYIDGLSLAQHARARGGFPLDEAVLVFLQIAEAVQEAHMRDVVLRDLQPSHVMLTHKRSGSSVAKITDVSTSRVLRRDQPGETCTRFAQVSPYAAPEILHESGVDERADIWSLGCLLYEVLTGRAPFEGEGMALAMRMAREEPPSVTELCPRLPKALDPIFGWALAKNPEHRFQSVYAFAHQLRPLACARGHLLIDQIAALAGSSAQPARAAQPPPEDDDNALTMVRHVRRRAPRVTHLAPVILQTPANLPTPPPLPTALPAPRVPSAPPLPPGRPLVEDSAELPWLQSQSARSKTRTAFWAALIALPLCALLVLLVAAPAPAQRAESGAIPAVELVETSELEQKALPALEVERAPAPTHAAPPRARSPEPQPQERSQFLDHVGASALARGRTTGQGRLAALAVGVPCDFLVDGKPIGSGTSAHIKLAAGLHRVSCKRPDGSTRNMSVSVEPGRAAMAVFR